MPDPLASTVHSAGPPANRRLSDTETATTLVGGPWG
jgi:hypothetical protein